MVVPNYPNYNSKSSYQIQYVSNNDKSYITIDSVAVDAWGMDADLGLTKIAITSISATTTNCNYDGVNKRIYVDNANLLEYKFNNPGEYMFSASANVKVNGVTIECKFEFMLPDIPQINVNYSGGTSDLTQTISGSISNILYDRDYNQPKCTISGNVITIDGASVKQFFENNEDLDYVDLKFSGTSSGIELNFTIRINKT